MCAYVVCGCFSAHVSTVLLSACRRRIIVPLGLPLLLLPRRLANVRAAGRDESRGVEERARCSAALPADGELKARDELQQAELQKVHETLVAIARAIASHRAAGQGDYGTALCRCRCRYCLHWYCLSVSVLAPYSNGVDVLMLLAVTAEP